MTQLFRHPLPACGLLFLLLSGGALCAFMLLPERDSSRADYPARQDHSHSEQSGFSSTPTRKGRSGLKSPETKAPAEAPDQRQAYTIGSSRKPKTTTPSQTGPDTTSLLSPPHRTRPISAKHRTSDDQPGHAAPAADTILSSSVPQPDHDATVPSIQQEAARLPVAFSLPDLAAEPGSPEEDIIHQAQQDFADEMAAAPDTDPASPSYAEHWRRAANAHDEYLRRTLGWDKFNQLSATASQRTHAGSASPE